MPGRPRPADGHRPRTVALEIAVASVEGARVALAGGADRVELCAALELGGVTPSQGLVELTAEVGIPVHVLVRCRPGDFVYDAEELALMEREVRTVLTSGASGVVVGALTPDGSLDQTAIRRFVAVAASVTPSAEVTLHRAIDRASDPVAAAGLLADLGLTRVLTSGGAVTAPAGRETITRMVRAAGPVEVMAGSGVSPADVPVLVRTGVAAVHLSAKGPVDRRASDGVPRGAAAADDGYFRTDPAVVAAARATLDRIV
jgi:copper homeostasis protein